MDNAYRDETTTTSYHETTTTTTQQQQVPEMNSAAAAPPLLSAALVHNLRNSDEYRAAWDVEVWKAIQLAHVQRELKELKQKSLQEWKQSLAEKEKVKLTAIDLQAKGLTTRERRIVEEEQLLDRRRKKLMEGEKEILRLREQLGEHRTRIDADAELRIQRIREDAAHRTELLQQRLTAAAEETKRLEDRLHSGHQDYMKLFEEFSSFKTKQLSNPDVLLMGHLERIRSEHQCELAALQDRLERRHQEQILTLTHQNNHLSEQVHRLSSSLSTKRQMVKQHEADLQRLTGLYEACKEDNQRLRLEKDTLARKLELAVGGGGDGPSTPRTQQQQHRDSDADKMLHLRELRNAVHACAEEDRKRRSCVGGANDGHSRVTASAAAAGSQATTNGVSSSSSGGVANNNESRILSSVGGRGAGGGGGVFSEDQRRILSEIQRLEKERAELLSISGGAYVETSPLIQTLDQRLVMLRQRYLLP